MAGSKILHSQVGPHPRADQVFAGTWPPDSSGGKMWNWYDPKLEKSHLKSQGFWNKIASHCDFGDGMLLGLAQKKSYWTRHLRLAAHKSSLHHVSGSQLKGGGMTRVFACKDASSTSCTSPSLSLYIHIYIYTYTYWYTIIYIYTYTYTYTLRLPTHMDNHNMYSYIYIYT